MDGATLDLWRDEQPVSDLRPLIIDSFAGGGGASTGIEMALGRSPDVAINHDPIALAMHEANHPDTLHMTNSVYAVDPRDFVKPGQRVGLAWFSPDCKHHSKAKGGKPLDRNIRDLGWVVVHYAELVKPEVIILENVEEYQDWCPLMANGRPDPARKGETFQLWVKRLERQGYKVELRQLRACDFGAPTIRKRLFVIARCDGLPIVWPDPTHGDPQSKLVKWGARKPWRSAAEIIDWDLPCPSIFDSSDEIRAKHGIKRTIRPLADNTLRKIARGAKRYVIDDANPFLVVCNHGGDGFRGQPLSEPMCTITAARDAHGLVTPAFVSYAQHGGANRRVTDPLHTITASLKDQNQVIAPTLIQTGYGERKGQAPRSLDLYKPLGTIVAGGTKHAVVSGFFAQHNGGPNMLNNSGRSARLPVSTITTRGTQQNVVTANLINMHGTTDIQHGTRSAQDPLTTLCAGGGHAALATGFLAKYYGQGNGQRVSEPCHTLTTRDRFGVIKAALEGPTFGPEHIAKAQAVADLMRRFTDWDGGEFVTVSMHGLTFVMVDIGMRMLTPREQFRAQGFPDSYVIDQDADGNPIPKTQQTHKCGNSVAPPLAKALAEANCPHLMEVPNA